jgi:CrcB protein
MPLLFVMVGGALGSAARYLTGRATLAWFGPDFPYGTLAVNLVGGLLMGVLAAALTRAGDLAEPWRLFLGVGVLGGFTTFSAFSLDVVTMIERGALGTALFYALISVIGSVLALFAGLTAARTLIEGAAA